MVSCGLQRCCALYWFVGSVAGLRCAKAGDLATQPLVAVVNELLAELWVLREHGDLLDL